MSDLPRYAYDIVDHALVRVDRLSLGDRADILVFARTPAEAWEWELNSEIAGIKVCSLDSSYKQYVETEIRFHRLLAAYDEAYRGSDYPSEPIGGGNPYHRCCACGRSMPEINSQLGDQNGAGHWKDCSWAEAQKALLRDQAVKELAETY